MAAKVNIVKYFIRHNYFLFFFVIFGNKSRIVKKCNIVCFCIKFSLKCRVNFKDVILL